VTPQSFTQLPTTNYQITQLPDGALSGARLHLPALIRVSEAGERLAICTVVSFEWLHGPRTHTELAAQEELVPRDRAVVFGVAEAEAAARAYARLRKPRGREMDIAIAACAIVHGAALWTLNRDDFRDIPGLRLA
jgi:predicted nucleic acid-binding protein